MKCGRTRHEPMLKNCAIRAMFRSSAARSSTRAGVAISGMMCGRPPVGGRSGTFFFLNPPRGRLDFAGQDLSAIGVRVNSLRLNDPSTGVYAFDLSLIVVPEPSSGLAVLGLGGLALLRRRRAV